MEGEPGPHMGLDGEDEDEYVRRKEPYVMDEDESLGLWLAVLVFLLAGIGGLAIWFGS